jgi:hypothetical protein
VYATCLHCHRPLGRNESIEAFPVGRRLAFDAAKGRLWVICPSCERWNLTPIEERWEAVESCERLFRGQKLRAQTENVGLARLAEGTELIRIGSPLRPEFAAWRYGRVFSARLHRRTALVAGVGAALGAGAYVTGAAGALLSLGPLLAVPIFHVSLLARAALHVKTMRVIGENGKPLQVNRRHLDHSRIVPNDSGQLHLHLRHSYGQQHLHGERASRALSSILARANGSGAGIGTTGAAASVIADAGDPVRAIARVAREAERLTGDFAARAAELDRAPRGLTIEAALNARQGMFRSTGVLVNRGALYRLPRVQRLALEMALHESSEQRALEDELEPLQRAWREAEEIAAIADGELTPVEGPGSRVQGLGFRV